MSEFLSLHDAVAGLVRPGDTVALEGFTHLIPFAAGHEVIRQGIGELTLIRMTPDLLYDQMIGCGLAKRLVFSWGGNPGVGSLHRLRDAVERGWPRPIELEEHSHAAMAHAYAAGAANMPAAFFRGYVGSDLARGEPERAVHRRARSPASGSPPSRRTGPTSRSCTRRRPTVRATCCSRASSACRRKRCSPPGARWSRSKRSWTRCRARSPNAVVLPSWTVTAIAVAPGGAKPSYAHGYYARDNAFYVAWDAISRDRAAFQAWIAEHVLSRSAEVAS